IETMDILSGRPLVRLILWIIGMTGGGKTRVLKGRGLLCAVLAASLCSPRLSTGISGQERKQSVQILAAAFPSPTILVNRGSPRLDQTRQRIAVDSLFVLVRLSGPAADRGRLVRDVKNARPQPRLAAKTQ